MLKPMLAVGYDPERLRFPYIATPKLDGIRCLAVGGEGRTRSLKLFPNVKVQAFFNRHAKFLDRLDGELIVGSPTAKDCFNRTQETVMSINGGGDFDFYVFDRVDNLNQHQFVERAALAQKQIVAAKLPNVRWLTGVEVKTYDTLVSVEARFLDEGYEGIMLRGPKSYYKFGRSTVNENSLLKVKRFEDAEAIIVGVEEQMHNSNVAFKNELGRTKRSTFKSGMVGKGVLGALIVQGLKGGAFAGVEFNVGTGFDDAQRAQLWKQRDKLNGKVIRYRYQNTGIKDAPRFPVYAGFRTPGT